MRLLSISIIMYSMLFFGCSHEKSFPVYQMWYDEPAHYFEETLVLGNGQIGATVFGGVKQEQIYLNDATLWSGEPVDSLMNPDAYKFIPQIREALRNENYKLADQLQHNVQGKFSESYAPLGTMTLVFDHSDSCTNYKRTLSLNDAISTISYNSNGVNYTREYFISYPNKVMAMKLKADESGALGFTLKFDSQLKYELSKQNGSLRAYGYAPVNAQPSYRGDIPNAVVNDPNRGTRFTTLFKILSTDGEIEITDDLIRLKDASEAVLLVSVATSFNGFDKDPVKEGLNNDELAKTQLDRASSYSYDELKLSHLNDYHHLFNRVSLDLSGSSDLNQLTTDERLFRYSKGENDPGLEALYFEFGRYLLISSSRTPGVPANLQGIWNPYLRPPWSSNYTTNINVEENYWLAETGNLSEMHQSLLSFIGNLSVTGTHTAKHFLGVDKGWMTAHNSDIWAMSNPVGDFGQGDPVWANWYMASPWLSTHLWEHFLFTQDMDFLGDYAYDKMKGAAQFCAGCLVNDGHGNLVTSPSTSPENRYVTPDGYVGATLYGATSDLAMIRECFSQVIEASKRLDIDESFRTELQNKLDSLYPYQIGKDGSLQEWYHDWADQDPRHRHQSHLFGLHPGHQITPEKTPELAKACERALIIKGDETTGWSKGWRINLWARLKDGDHAYKMYRELLRYVEPDAIRKEQHGGGTYPNLFDAHPPFQIDGNFGGAAAVIEMLMQSSENNISLLPALPEAWSSGSINGIRARGGFEVSIEWKDGKLHQAVIKNIAGNACSVSYNGQNVDLNIEKGVSVTLNENLQTD